MIECHLRYGIDSWCFGNTTIQTSIQRSCTRFLQIALKTSDQTQLETRMEENKILSFSYNSLPIGPEYLKPFLPIFG